MSETFPLMWKVLPEGVLGRASVAHFVVDQFASRMTAIRGGRDFVPEGKYARLEVNGVLAMSDTPYERRTNYEIVRQARGRVLIAGYGLGMVLTAVLKKSEVREVVVVEKEADVVALVDPHVRAWVGPRASQKLTTIIADIFKARPLVTGKFDCLWFDIWSQTSTDDLAVMATLTRRYLSAKARGGFIGHWDREWLQYRRQQERRAGW